MRGCKKAKLDYIQKEGGPQFDCLINANLHTHKQTIFCLALTQFKR